MRWGPGPGRPPALVVVRPDPRPAQEVHGPGTDETGVGGTD